jgi:hypothetical protein
MHNFSQEGVLFWIAVQRYKIEEERWFMRRRDGSVVVHLTATQQVFGSLFSPARSKLCQSLDGFPTGTV